MNREDARLEGWALKDPMPDELKPDEPEKEEKVDPMTDKAVTKIIQRMRIFKDQIDSYNEKVKELKNKLTDEEHNLLKEMDELGVDRVAGEGLSCSKKLKYSGKIVDTEQYIKHTLHDYPGLLFKRVKIGALKEIIDQTGEPPEGVEVSTYDHLSVRRVNT